MTDTQMYFLSILLGVIGFLVVWILNRMERSMTDTKTAVEKAVGSVNKLNEKVAVVIERIEYHDERIKRLEDLRISQ